MKECDILGVEIFSNPSYREMNPIIYARCMLYVFCVILNVKAHGIWLTQFNSKLLHKPTFLYKAICISE